MLFENYIVGQKKMIKLSKKRLGLLGLGLGLGVLTLGGFGYSVGAFQGDYTQKGPNCDPERHQLMLEAFQNNDYEAWKNLMGDRGRVTEVINQDNFSKFAEAHKLALEGNFEEARALREELGLRNGNGERRGLGYGKGMGQGRLN
jgi:hypothetical protein